MRSTAAIKIDEAVTVGLTCLQEGLDNKDTVKKNILAAVSRNLFPIQEASTLEELPVTVFEMLHEQLGLGFNIHDGKITGVSIERRWFDPVLKEKFERLFAAVDRGIDFSPTWPDATAAMAYALIYAKGGEN